MRQPKIAIRGARGRAGPISSKEGRVRGGWCRTHGRLKLRYAGADNEGKYEGEGEDESDETHAYSQHLRQCDPEALRAESERLYNEVITEYGDVPYVTVKQRELAALLKEPVPTSRGKPLSPEDRRRIEQRLSLKTTLGEAASVRLDELHNLVAGKPAPEIDGVDMAGKPLKLSDFRDKVVVLVFWGSWCGPCMRGSSRTCVWQSGSRTSPSLCSGWIAETTRQPLRRPLNRTR